MKVMTIEALNGLAGPNGPSTDPLMAFQGAGDELDAALVELMDASERHQLPPDGYQAFMDRGDALLDKWMGHMGAVDSYDEGGDARTRWVHTAESITQDIADFRAEAAAFVKSASGSFPTRFVLLTAGSVLLLGGAAYALVYAGKNK